MRHRVQALVVGSRDDAFLDKVGFGGREVSGYWTLDYLATLRAGRGTVSIGVENLLNAQYYTLPSQLMSNGSWTSHAAARGAVFTVGYGVTY